MSIWVVGALYLIGLAIASKMARDQQTDEATSFVLGGSNLNVFLGVLTYGATLFSTFTLMGMPNFFRVHGVGAWIFLGVTDVAMAYVVLVFGLKLRQRFKNKGYLNVSSFIKDQYTAKWTPTVYLLGIFLFLIPYTAVQLKGIGEFLEASIPGHFPMWGWASIMLVIILIYSSIGGFKAIVYSDAIQGILLLFTSWIIGYLCLKEFSSLENLFFALEKSQPKLLSVPGPNNLFTFQFLISSYLAIILMPMSQPQLTTRLLAMADDKKLRQMAASLAFFSIIIIFPAIFIGLAGALKYGEVAAPIFWAKTLITDRPELLGAFSVIGLLAAAMSTADSQLFALGNETHILFKNDPKKIKTHTKFIIAIFALLSLLFAVYAKGDLVPLARLSFAGTSLLAPMVFLPVWQHRKQHGPLLPLMTLMALLLFLSAYILKIIPSTVFHLRLDLALLLALFSVSLFCGKFQSKELHL